MKKESTRERDGSRVEWENLEEWVRGHVQHFIQDVLEQEVTEFLGRGKSERRRSVDGASGYRNGHGKVRRLTLSCERENSSLLRPILKSSISNWPPSATIASNIWRIRPESIKCPSLLTIFSKFAIELYIGTFVHSIWSWNSD